MQITIILMMIFSIMSKILGFMRDIILSYFYGASITSDAYLVALTIPTFVFSFIGMGIKTNYIPMYSKIKQNNGRDEADKFTNNIINHVIIMITFILIASLVFTNFIVKLFVSGFEGEILKTTILFTRICILGAYFYIIGYIFIGYLQINKKFIVVALIGIPYNIIIIMSIIISNFHGIIWLPIGSVLADFVQFFILGIFTYKQMFRYKVFLDKDNKYIKNFIILSIPVIIGVSVNQVNLLVDRTIASSIAIGGISAMTYANRLNMFVQTIIVSVIVTVIYPEISKLAVNKKFEELKIIVTNTINSTSLLIIPISIVTMIFSKPIVKLLFDRGAFDNKDVLVTSNILAFYSIGMIAFSIREIISRVFYSLQDTKTPMINAIFSMVVNIVLNIILSRYLGLPGLAIATSISAIISTAILVYNLKNKMELFNIKDVLKTILKIILSSIIMGIVSNRLYLYFLGYISYKLALVLAIILGGIIYLTLIFFMKIEEINILKNMINKCFNKSKINQI
ncbi:murein biosynthesis integral membrane protein MurJ [Clostridium perfringens]|nr:murein biosynthesis integral membrane protein MurJ [Clostridium perfringens]